MEHDNSTFEETTATSGTGTTGATGPETSTAGTQTNTGTFQPPPPSFQVNGPKRLYRSNGPVGGVAEGLSDYTGVDAVLFRLGIVALSIVAFPAIPLVYLAAWIIIPRADLPPVPPIMAPNPVAQPQTTDASFHPDAPAPSADSVSAR